MDNLRLSKKLFITPFQIDSEFQKELLFVNGNRIFTIFKNTIQYDSGYESYNFGIKEIDDVWLIAGVLSFLLETKTKYVVEEGDVYESLKTIDYNRDGTFSHYYNEKIKPIEIPED
ncbi:MAG: hypothetical protein IPJ01_11800 [Micavibrio sp.]|nr:hypothetical protein [Micavibrio sp.]